MKIWRRASANFMSEWLYGTIAFHLLVLHFLMSCHRYTFFSCFLHLMLSFFWSFYLTFFSKSRRYFLFFWCLGDSSFYSYLIFLMSQRILSILTVLSLELQRYFLFLLSLSIVSKILSIFFCFCWVKYAFYSSFPFYSFFFLFMLWWCQYSFLLSIPSQT